MIDRNDMLELTRRMTPERSCFTRIAGAYMDSDGEIDNTFNVSFLNLKKPDKIRNLKIAKTVPFSKTNEQLKEYSFSDNASSPGSMRQLLSGIHACGLKNDLLMEVLYEQIGKHYRSTGDYAAAVFHGVYDVPMKSTDNGYLYESEVVYDFLICTVSPLLPDYEIGRPDFGFLYPAFSYRTGDPDAIDIFHRVPEAEQTAMIRMLLGKS